MRCINLTQVSVANRSRHRVSRLIARYLPACPSQLPTEGPALRRHAERDALRSAEPANDRDLLEDEPAGTLRRRSRADGAYPSGDIHTLVPRLIFNFIIQTAGALLAPRPGRDGQSGPPASTRHRGPVLPFVRLCVIRPFPSSDDRCVVLTKPLAARNSGHARCRGAGEGAQPYDGPSAAVAQGAPRRSLRSLLSFNGS